LYECIAVVVVAVVIIVLLNGYIEAVVVVLILKDDNNRRVFMWICDGLRIEGDNMSSEGKHCWKL